jgi:phosphate transport system substrate-binding protein
MFRSTRTRIVALALLVVAAATGPATAETALKGAGATFPYPLYSKWFKDYAAVDPSVSFSYDANGSGAGIKGITEQSVDFGASDKFLTDAELKAAPGKLLHIPTVMGAVAVSYNLPGIPSGVKLTPEALSGIYLGKITRWSDPLLAKTNPALKLPNRQIVVLYRSDRSGTSSIFTDYLSKISAAWSRSVGQGTGVTWPTGVGAKGSNEVVKQIKATPYSIGYIEIAYALENDLSCAQLRNKSGKFVRPTMLSTRAAAVNALQKVTGDCRISLVNQPGKDAYPIVGLTWLLVYQQQKDAEKGRALVEFLNWELKHAEKMTSTLYYTPLPKKLADLVEKSIKSISYPQQGSATDNDAKSSKGMIRDITENSAAR